MNAGSANGAASYGDLAAFRNGCERDCQNGRARELPNETGTRCPRNEFKSRHGGGDSINDQSQITFEFPGMLGKGSGRFHP
jgi:hypothetical protein